MKTVEHEKKMLLSLPEYNALFEALSEKGSMATQTNHYYDTPDLNGNANGITYRIREKNGKYTATVKVHHALGADGSTEASSEVRSPFDTSFFTVSDLSYQGCMTTDRLTVCPYPGIELALDKNRYFHFTDYELEIEYGESAENAVEAVLCDLLEIWHRNGIPASFLGVVSRLNMGRNKSERFFAKQAQIEAQTETQTEGI